MLAVLAIYVVIITPLLVVNLQKKQELRGRAQIATTPTPVPSCGNVATDIILIIDRSSSMNDDNKIEEAKAAAKSFVDVIANDTNTSNRIGLVSFDHDATLNNTLTNNFASIKTKIDSISLGSGTCTECGIVKANQEISANGRPDIKKVVIMLTDGRANYIIGVSNLVDPELAESKALEAVKAGFYASKTVFFTIGFGTEEGDDEYNREFLQAIATLTGGKHYYPAPGELDEVYKEISTLIGKGLLGGFIFNDINGNGAFDTSEPKLSGWNVQLISSTDTKTFTSDTTGSYNITGLCDGNYQLKEVLKSGWLQTLPTDPNGYTITITNGSQYTNKNFGDKIAPPTPTLTITPTPKPTATPTPRPTATPTPRPTATPIPTLTPTPKPSSTPTPKPTATPIPTATTTPKPTATTTPKPTATPNPTPANTYLDITVYQHGIWNSGDNSNPDGTLSNKKPVHLTINADLELFDTNNQVIGKGNGPLTYDSTKGNYQGSIGIYPNTFPSDKYYLKVKTTTHLKRLVPGILTITAGQKNTVPDATLVTGDANNDNKLNILDYNLLLGCYSDLAAAVACDADKKVATDFNDDSLVNQVDYNLFLREIATQPGE